MVSNKGRSPRVLAKAVNEPKKKKTGGEEREMGK